MDLGEPFVFINWQDQGKTAREHILYETLNK